MNTVLIISASLEPNPSGIGQSTLLKVVVLEAETNPTGQTYLSGEFRSGEV